MTKLVRFLILTVLVSLVVLVLVAPSISTAQTANGSIRLLQAAPDVQAADVFVNNQKVINNLRYEDVSNYVNLPVGSYDLKVFPSSSNGQGTPVLDVPNFTVSQGNVQTLILAGLAKDKSISALPLSDSVSAPSAGKAKVRFIHSSPDAPAVNINVNGLGNVFNNIGFKNVGNYTEVPAGTWHVTANVTSTGQMVLSRNLTLQAGKVYTICATGLISNQSLSVIVSEDGSNSKVVLGPISGAPETGIASEVASTGTWRQIALVVALLVLAGSFVATKYINRKS